MSVLQTSREGDGSSIASAQKRIKQFKVIYDGFFWHHVVPVLHLGPRRLTKMKKTQMFNVCRSTLQSDKVNVEELFALSCHSMGHNEPFLKWIIDSCVLLRARIHNPQNQTEKAGFRESIMELTKLLNGTCVSPDDHSLVLWAWWLPQIIEIFALTRLIFKEIEKLNETGSKAMLKSLGSCFEYFQENTSMALYLFAGGYMLDGPRLEIQQEDIKTGTKLKGLVSQLNSLAKENTHSLRRLLHNTRKFPKSQLSPIQPTLLTYYEQKQEELLLEPKFTILMALSRLILVQHEDEETGRILLRFCGSKNCLIGLMKTAINKEISTTASSEVLFREESVATKLMSALFFSQWGGTEYLHQVVRPTLQSIAKSTFANEDVDLDNEMHMSAIRQISEDLLNRVYNSSHLFPTNIRVLLSHTQREASQKFPEMRCVVVGSFLFLRFIVPVLVSPERYHLKTDLNVTSTKAVILVSRIVQTIANGGTARGKLQPLQVLVESHQKPLHEYFDKLADISEVMFSSGDFQFAIEPSTIYADFNVIIAYLCDLSREMKQVIPSYFDDETMTRYMEFLNISSPSIFSQLLSRDGLYYDIVKNLADMLPSVATTRLLGVSEDITMESPSYTWYTKFTKVQQLCISLAKKIPAFREELLKTLCYLVEIHEFLGDMLSKWGTPKGVTERKQSSIRKAYYLSYLLYRTRNAPIAFFIPEAWDIWSKYLDMVDILCSIIVEDALAEFEKTELAASALMQTIVSTRWIISRLVSIQARNLQGI